MTLPPQAIPRRAVWSWILYDLANTIFSMGVVSLYFSLWVREQVGADRADTVYGIITAVSMGIIFVISPLLGAMTDRAPRRMPFLVVSTIVCVGLTASLARSGYWVTMLAFVLANAAYQAGLQFYDALLPEVTTEENRGRISGIGVGIGYLGSFVAVGLGFLPQSEEKPFVFTAIAVSFLLFSIPCFLWVKERGNPNPRPVFSLAMIRESTAETLRTLRGGKEYPGLIRFLVGRVFYTDAINTVINIMMLYTVNVVVASGQSEEGGERTALLVMFVAISFAVVGGFVWGQLVDRRGPKRTLDYVLWLWVATFAMAAAVGLLGLPWQTLFVVASMAGVSLGGIWSADRPLMLRLTPPDRIGEFYGLYGMVGRFSAIIGPMIWAFVAWLCIGQLGMTPIRGQGIGVLVLLGFIFVARAILGPVRDDLRPGARGAP
ncbi:MFS transporter [Pseudogemmatithrix spongiicola]|uniref:MFS transporter n=1 Tax=Pseudogemmatithrix spongiicola TaxID=3062599 RepID=A0AA49JYE0_9BACT|nr:MFS transporter [Gemmatimonadaceae bacterium 'strain 318']